MISQLTSRHSRVVALTAFVVLAFIPFDGCSRASITKSRLAAEPPDPRKLALAKVEEDRGEAAGRKATVTIPEQLKHYVDRRRFLAVQAAYSQEHVNSISRDFADLLKLIQRHELVEMIPLGTDYILYGVGESVSGEPFSHYDQAAQQDIPLAATEASLTEQARQAADAARESASTLADLETKRRRTRKRDRAQQAALAKEIVQAKKTLASKKSRSKLLTAFFASPERRNLLLAEYQSLSDVARDFEGETYDLTDSDSRRRFKIRLLSYIRPEARDLLIQIAQEYKQKFDRPLPVSSLVRPVQYQRELGATNSNVARGATPPHSTGLAFDLFYRYMSAAEQDYLMSTIARLEAQGRVEALRETRDNIHVYVFGNGHPPEDQVIARVIAAEAPRKVSKKTRVAAAQSHKTRKKPRVAAARR
ncbi:MAG: DUF5715 family protein [Blastocatellia bacterium]